ncbi:response regulator transcription factor [Xanthobacter autotrophicus]|nr:response regulator transcription factor [Xanthobacter autotrophicus]MDI4657623.1 response regulator transcription factor [Xanthobacter autotrophicus]
MQRSPSRPAPPSNDPVVIVVDDDAALREALSSLFRSIGLEVALFASAAEFLAAKLPEVPRCLVLDIRLPGVSGLDFQAQLARTGTDMPVIFMTGHGDIPMTVRAMKAGAVDFLTKPFRDQDMLDAVAAAIEIDRARRDERKAASRLTTLYETLSPREKQVMALVTAGLMNKQVAAEVGLSEITVKIHRGHVMRKMEAHSLADLVRMAQALGLDNAKG